MFIDTTAINLFQPLPFWDHLSTEDKAEYQRLKESFHQQHLAKGKSNSFSFQNDLRKVLAYVERRPENQELRSIVCGICFGNSFVCVNTRQLKLLIGKCKSSINNGFQHLGYVSAKNKVKQSLFSVLPNLSKDPALVRQWTVRCADSNALPIKKLLMTTQQRPLLPTPQINSNIRREALPMPLFYTSPKGEVEETIIQNIIIQRPLSTPILPSSYQPYSIYEEDNLYDQSMFQKEDSIFTDNRENINFDDNNNNISNEWINLNKFTLAVAD